MIDLVDRLETYGAILLETIAPGDERPAIWLFDRPTEVISARDGAEWEHALLQLDEHVRRGAYAAGYVAYEAGFVLEPAAGALPVPPDGPLLWFGIYREPLSLRPADLEQLASTPSFEVRSAHFGYTRSTYSEAFQRVRAHIYEGDAYQINLTGPLTFDFHGSPLRLYDAMRRSQQRALGAVINGGDRFILSRSPELFFSRYGDRMRTRPMKGTAARGADPVADERQEQTLRSDEKSTAENLMIVDLLRNDLSVVCEPGSVHVPALFSTERHETLIQMTSTVEGRLREGTSYSDIFRALFPCGSVTGAPRIRAMQIIQALEPAPRGAYCGAIGWIGPSQEAVFNVAIRTAEIRGNQGRLGIGSGIVWDSEEEAEYEECLLKADFFIQAVTASASSLDDDLQLIETMRAEGGAIPLLHLHLQRLRDSALTLGFSYDERRVRDAIHAATAVMSGGTHKVRLVLGREGTPAMTTQRLDTAMPDPIRLAVARHRVRAEDVLRRHKTTRRAELEAAYQAGLSAGADEVILLNDRGEVAEGTRSNVIIRRHGILLTPPVSSGALPGVYRAYLLATRDDVQQRVLNLADLLTADQIFVCNAVRGMREAVLARDGAGRLVQVGASRPDPEPDGSLPSPPTHKKDVII